MAAPCTAATRGFPKLISAATKRSCALSPGLGGCCRKSSRSLPAVKASPAPCTPPTRFASSLAAASSCSASVKYMFVVIAFFFAGRLSCRRSPLPQRSVLISVKVSMASDEGAEAGDRLADDQVLHLVRTLVRIEGLRVREEARDVVFEADAIAAVQLARP